MVKLRFKPRSQNSPKWTETSLQDRSLVPMNCYESPWAHPGQSDMIWPLYASTLTKLNLVLFRSKVCPVLLIYENGYKEYLELRRYLHVYTALHVYRPSLILYAFDVDWGPLTPPLKALEEHCQNGNRAFGSARKFMVRVTWINDGTNKRRN